MYNLIKKLNLPKIFYINLFLLFAIISFKLYIQLTIGYTELLLNTIIQLIILNILYFLTYKYLGKSKLVSILKYFIFIFSIITAFDAIIFSNQVTILLRSPEYSNEKIFSHTPTDLGNRFEVGKDSEGNFKGYVVDRNNLLQIEKSDGFEKWEVVEEVNDKK